MFQPPFIPAKSTHQMYLKQALQDLFTPCLSQAKFARLVHYGLGGVSTGLTEVLSKVWKL